MFSISSSSIDLVQTHSALALNQLSEDDRKVVARLKQTYPLHILAAVFQDAELSQGTAIAPLAAGLIQSRPTHMGQIPRKGINRLFYAMPVERPLPRQRRIHIVHDNIAEQFGVSRLALQEEIIIRVVRDHTATPEIPFKAVNRILNPRVKGPADRRQAGGRRCSF